MGPNDLRLGDEDHWHILSEMVDDVSSLPSVLIHLGGQVPMAKAFHETRKWLEMTLPDENFVSSPSQNSTDTNEKTETKKLSKLEMMKLKKKKRLEREQLGADANNFLPGGMSKEELVKIEE